MSGALAEFAGACGGRLIGEDRTFREVSIDSRTLARGDLFAALPGQHRDGHDYAPAAAHSGAAGVLVSRALELPIPQILVPQVEAALTAAAAQWRARLDGALIGVAGSNGKTTVKEMLGAILTQLGPCLTTRGNLNNQLGVPLTLLRLERTHRCAVVEIGANRPGEVRQLVRLARPTIGLITNAGAEHLEGFGDVEGAARAEGEMVAALPESATALINADDAFAPLWHASTRAQVLSFGLRPAADVRAEQIERHTDVAGFRTRFLLRTAAGSVRVELQLAGQHNIYNALAAAAAAAAAGASLTQIAAGLAAMRAVHGRLEFRRTRHGAWLIDDSYNANPSSVGAALEVLGELAGRRWLVLGDMAELGAAAERSHRELGALAREHGVERLFALGPLAALAADSFGPGAERCGDLESLAQRLDAQLDADVRLLIKGSRFNRLERLVEALSVAPNGACAQPARRGVS